MALQAETTSDLSVAEFGAVLSVLNIPQRRAAELFAVTSRHIRRWKSGDRRVPHSVAIILRLLAGGAITLDQIEKVVASAPVQTNDRAKPRPPRETAVPLVSLASPARTNGNTRPELAPVLVEPASASAALVRTETAAFADSDLSTAEKVLALASNTCRWPVGDPRRPDFHFCGDPVARGSYCEHHCTMDT